MTYPCASIEHPFERPPTAEDAFEAYKASRRALDRAVRRLELRAILLTAYTQIEAMELQEGECVEGFDGPSMLAVIADMTPGEKV